MFRNYLKIALRNILKHKGYSFINIVGLALGLACSILILLWVRDELSFDRFHQNSDTLYRVEEDQYYSGKVFHVNVTPFPSAPVWRDEIPEIIDATRYSWSTGLLLRHGDKAFFEEEIRAVDASFFSMFSFPLIRGEASRVFEHRYSTVITEKIAQKYFQDEDPIGKIFSANNQYDFVVTGVVANPPGNSSLQFDMLVPFEFTKDMGWYNDNWGSNSIQTFVKLQEQVSTGAVNEKMTATVRTHNEESTTDFMVMPLVDIHLYAYFGFGRQVGNIQYVYIFSLVALFVLLLACINFMNLSTARSANRAKEIGMRKVSGALRGTIAGQFLGESVIYSLTALVLAVGLVGLVLPAFNLLAGKEIASNFWADPVILFGLGGIALLTGLVAGIYPAFFLSSFKPVSVLKGAIGSGARSSALRKVLVVTQFALSVFLIIGASVVYNQLAYMRSKDLGYDQERLLYIKMRGNIGESYHALKSELLSRPEILDVTATEHPPGRIGSNSGGAKWQGKDPEQKLLVSQNRVDYDFAKTLKIQMADGRAFSPEFPSDLGSDSTGAFLINEELASLIAQDVTPVLGQALSFIGRKGKIIGIMKDFHFNSVRRAIPPLALAMDHPQELGSIAIRIRPGDISESIDAIRGVWSSIIPNYPFDFKFVDQDLDRMYRAEERMVGVLKYFAGLATVISCLGLLGLASFMAEQRTKEIGVRKVLGASVPSIVALMSREFTRWVLLANLVAWPIAYLVLENWLQKFAYRIDVGWLVFLLAGALALVVALLTVSSQAIRSALSNPADALRYE